MSGYTNQRTMFDKLVIRYKAYLKLYKQINNGSIEGATPFDQFYWRFTYYVKYEEPTSVNNTGY